ncbi:MAG: GH116 family glycosyl-hydrolase [Sulfolobales archaeon]
MRIVSKTEDLSSVALGGIGTGSIEISARGSFQGWEIFNNKPWSDYGQPEEYMGRDDMVFILRVSRGDENSYMLVLKTEPWFSWKNYDPYAAVNDALNPYQTPWIRSVESLEFEAQPPLVRIKYHDRWLEREDLEAQLEIFSPLVIGDLRNSSTPALILIFTLANRGKAELDVSVAGFIKNPHNFNDLVTAVTERISVKGYTGVKMRGENIPESHGMFRGSMALVALEPGVSVASFTLDMSDRGRYSDSLRRVLVDLRKDGAVNLDPEKRVSGSREKIFSIVSKTIRLSPGEEKKIIFILAWYYPNHVDRYGRLLGHYYENYYRSVEEVIDHISTNLSNIYEKIVRMIRVFRDTSYEEFLSELALSQITTLAKSTWLTRDEFFAVWEGGPGTCAGLSTVDVAYWAFPSIVYLYPQLGVRMVLEWSRHVLTPDKSPYYEIFALAYPENMSVYRERLKRDPSIQHDVERLREVVREIIRETNRDPSGRVMHCYTASPDRVDNYDRNDLMPEYILLASLAYIVTGDRDLLRMIRDKIRLVIDGTLKQHDDAKTRLIYHMPPSGYEGFSQAARSMSVRGFEEIMRILFSGPAYYPVSVNTYDNMSLHGVASFTADLWVAALRISKEIFREAGDIESLEFVERVFREAVESYSKLLWNGEYFDNWYDPFSGYRDRGVLTASLAGEWYLRPLAGLDYTVDLEKILSTLRSIYKYNYREIEGLLNLTYPSHPRPSLEGDMVYPNNTRVPYLVGGQADTPWSGVEIQVALHMIWEGMTREGLEILRDVHERYRSWGMYWNHMECDGHYFRVLVALQIPNHLAGVRFLGYRQRLDIDPKYPRDSFKGPIILPSTLASLKYEENQRVLSAEVRVEIGFLPVEVREVRVRASRKPGRVDLYLDSERVEIEHEYLESDKTLVIRLDQPIKLVENKTLRIVGYYD